MAVEVNTWEEPALMTTAGHPRDTPTFSSESLIYPGLYSPSGVDVLTIFAYIHSRPNPAISLGAVDPSCAILICDLTPPGKPIIYASNAFTSLTGYTASEVTGKSCRFLQFPPPPPASPPISSLLPWTGTIADQPPSTPIPAPPFPQPRLPPLPVRHFSQPAPFTFSQAQLPRSSDLPAPTQLVSAPNDRQRTHTTIDTDGQVKPERAVQDRKRRGDGLGPYQDDAVAKMREAVQRNQEVQVRVVNYKKTGEAFVNLVSIIPVPGRMPSYGGGGDAVAGETRRGFTLSVGFLCDISGEE